MSEVIDYGRFAERLRQVMPRWEDRDRMSSEEFAAHLADTGPRWELLRAFQEEWGYEPPGGEPRWPRWSEDEHRAYVRRLKEETTGEEEDALAGVDLALPIPAALDEWWDLPFNSFTYRPRLYWTNPEWPPTVRPDPTGYGASDGLPPDNPFVGPAADHRVCVFKAEYQYCNEWGYLAAEAAQADPRVVVSTEDGWVVQSGSISEFFLQLALMRLPGHFGWTVRLYEAGPDVEERVRENFPAMGLPPWRELGSRTIAYGAPDAIVYLDGGGYADFGLVVHARSRTALEEVARTLGVDWSEEIESPEADRPEPGPPPLSLKAGDADADGRWTVESVSDAPYPPGEETVPPAEILGTGRPDGVTVWAEEPGTGVVAGDQAGGVHLWPVSRPEAAADAEAASDGAVPEPVPLHRSAHDAPVTAVAGRRFEHLGVTVVSGDSDGLVDLWLLDGDWGPTEIARHDGKVVGVGTECLETGPTLAAAWSTGTVRLWDIGSGLNTILELGTGIEALRLDPEGTITVGGPTGSAIVRLDVDRLWPRRDLTAAVHRFDWDQLECVTGPAGAVPDLLLTIVDSDDAAAAEGMLADLRAMLYEGARVFSATVVALPCLLMMVGEEDSLVRLPLLDLAGEIVRAASEPASADEEARRWAGHTRSALENCVPALYVLMDADDPAVRAASALLLSEVPEARPDDGTDPLSELVARIEEETEVEALAGLVVAAARVAEARVGSPPAVFSRLLAESGHREVRAAAAAALLRCGAAGEVAGRTVAEAIDRELAAPESALDRPLRVIGLTRSSFLRDTR
ncbi:WD40 repeat domain-containing protein [Actinoallomurus iriomotensis]|uniref:Uncharacterized protein n=1 Tax=Actinoallomurus iriomotensis TaxID=478107 RepID=A0A9W6VM83_9ACTN|nr:hypothetical protein [Actinoallomurus iriomotensis]GLY73445.1 hypothetical protein Airi01_017120 [Actinoallomurus iriomotensis]